MAYIVKTAVVAPVQVCEVEVSFDDKLRNARKVLLSILSSKKDMMDTDERTEFLRVDEGLCGLINGTPSRVTREDTLAAAKKLLKYYAKKGVL
jgi:hypothetical protein